MAIWGSVAQTDRRIIVAGKVGGRLRCSYWASEAVIADQEGERLNAQYLMQQRLRKVLGPFGVSRPPKADTVRL